MSRMELEKAGHSSSGGEVSSCVSNLMHAFSDGLNVFKRLRERRRRRKSKHKGSSDAAELQLSNSLRRGPKEIQASYEGHYGRAGEPFAKGDSIAHASLAETLIKLNTGLVGIIATFLNHDSKHSHLNLDYRSLVNLSDSSRQEAIGSLNQLYQRLSQSQLQLYRTMQVCPKCGSTKHHNCGHRKASPDHDHKVRHTGGSRQRIHGPTIARMPVKQSSHTQLVVVRPKTSRKGSSSSGSSTKSQSTAMSSPYASPLSSPLPQYSPIDPFPPQPAPAPQKSPNPKKKSHSPTGRRRADSFDGPRPTTWPRTRPEHHLPPPFTLQQPPPRPPKVPISTSTPKSPSPKSQLSPSPISSPGALPIKRRIDKHTPSTYTFASDSTKLGEIPQYNWTTPWDYEEAERRNKEAAERMQVPVVAGEGKTKKKGIFGFLRKGSAGTA